MLFVLPSLTKFVYMMYTMEFVMYILLPSEMKQHSLNYLFLKQLTWEDERLKFSCGEDHYFSMDKICKIGILKVEESDKLLKGLLKRFKDSSDFDSLKALWMI